MIKKNGVLYIIIEVGNLTERDSGNVIELFWTR